MGGIALIMVKRKKAIASKMNKLLKGIQENVSNGVKQLKSKYQEIGSRRKENMSAYNWSKTNA